jgi:hypothetical protein
VAGNLQESSAGDRRTYALRHGKWFDGTAFVDHEFYSVGGILSGTHPAHVDSTLDLTGRYIVPPYSEGETVAPFVAYMWGHNHPNTPADRRA